MNTDRIEKEVLIRATLDRVWHAISDAKQFGSWFGVSFDGPFTTGARLTGRLCPTTVDEEIAQRQKACDGIEFEILVDCVDPMKKISFRWHPCAVDPAVDYSKEPTTLVVFELRQVDGGVLLNVSESGFDQIPLARRAKAFEANDSGWTIQMELIQRYLAARQLESTAS
jgi:uncharacterized protein YndB with AHSA1/START domain